MSYSSALDAGEPQPLDLAITDTQALGTTPITSGFLGSISG